MMKLNKYNDFLNDMLFEKSKSMELPFVLSDRLFKFLKKIDHGIATELLKYHSNNEYSKYTLVDYDDDEHNKFTMATSSKIMDYIISQTNVNNYDKNLKYFKTNSIFNDLEIWKKYRGNPIKIGRFINKVFPDKFPDSGNPGFDIQSFIKIFQSKKDINSNFEIVSGEDIIKYYDEDSYTKKISHSELHLSCMKYKKCKEYLHFYVKNDVKMIILKDKNGKLKGRALLWDIHEINNKEINRKFMDRVYTNVYTDEPKFIDLSVKEGWLYKKIQTSSEATPIVDPTGQFDDIDEMKTYHIKQNQSYPYLDTLKYFNVDDNYLTNNIDDYSTDLELESPYGGYIDKETEIYYIYDSYDKKLVDEDYAIHCEEQDVYAIDENTVHSIYNDTHLTKDYAKEHYVYSDILVDWLPKSESVYIESLNDYVTKTYADSNYVFCDYDDNYYTHDDGLPSDEWVIVPHEHAVLVFLNDNSDFDNLSMIDVGGGEVDARWEDDGSYFTIEYKGKEYNFDHTLENSEIINKMKNDEKY